MHMSNWTYVCAQCGNLRRRPAVYRSSEGVRPATFPRCCEQEMVELMKGYAEAATKLGPEQRIRWLAAGGYVYQRPGRRWTAAFTPNEIAIAAEKLVGITAAK